MEDKPKSIILVYEDFKSNIADVTNQYLEKLPAIFIAEFYEKMANTVNEIAKQQLVAVNQESEVKEDGKREGTC